MPLQKQVVPIPFVSGLDQKTDPFQIQPGKLAALVNGRFQKNGSIVTRPGCSLLSSTIGGALANAGQGRLAAIRDELLWIDGKQIASYSPAYAGFVSKGPAPEAMGSRSSITSDVANAWNPDCAIGSGVIVYVWLDGQSGGNVYFSVLDAATGAQVRSAVQLASGARYPRVCYLSSAAEFVITYIDTGGSTIHARTYTPSSDIVSGATSIVTNNASGTKYEIGGLASTFALAYRDNTGRFTAIMVNGSLTTTITQSATSASSNATILAMAATSGEQVWVLYSLSGGTKYANILSLDASTLAEVSTETTVVSSATDTPSQGGLARVSASRVCPIVVSQTSAGGLSVQAGLFDKGASSAATQVLNAGFRRTYWAQLASKPIQIGTKVYAWMYVGGARPGGAVAGSSQYSLIFCDLGVDNTSSSVSIPARPVTSVAMRSAVPDLVTATSLPASIVSPAMNIYSAPGRLLRSNAGRAGLIAAVADFGHAGRWLSSELGGELYFGGGSPSFYDSSKLAEIGFLTYPEAPTVVWSNGAGSLVPGVSYTWIFCYAQPDARGQMHRGIFSAPFTSTCPGGMNTATFTLPPCSVTMRQTSNNGFAPNIAIETYRTQGNPTTNPVYYLVPQDAAAPSPLNETTTVTDGLSDATIATSPQPYTQGGAVERVAPPAARAIATWKGRVWILGDDGRTLWFSGPFVEGEAVWFADEFTIPLDITGTALGVLDDKLIAFGSSAIQYLVGNGPDNTGAGSDYVPDYITSDLGCNEPRSLALTQTGLLFQSRVGLYMLSRALEVSYHGRAVEDSVNANPTITSAMLHPSGAYVLWSATAASSGIRVMWDYIQDAWGTDGVLGSAQVLSQVAIGSSVYFLTSTGSVYQETAASYTDAGAFVSVTCELPWLQLAGMQGYQRVWTVSLLGRRYTSHDLKVEIATDFAPTFPQTKIFGSTWTDPWPLEQGKVHVVRQLSEAIKVRFTTQAPTGLGAAIGVGQGIAVTGVALEVGVMPGSKRTAANQRG